MNHFFKKLNLRLLLFIFASVIAINFLKAQNHQPIIKRLSQQHSEFDNGHITDVAQDSNGYLWFCGSHGLFKYDGKTLEKIKLQTPLDFILFSKDAKEKLWVLSYSGNLFQINNDSLIPYQYNQKIKKYTFQGRLTSFYVDEKDQLHLGMKNLGYYIVTKEGYIQKKINRHQGINGIVVIKINKENYIFFQLYSFNAKAERIYLSDPKIYLFNSKVQLKHTYPIADQIGKIYDFFICHAEYSKDGRLFISTYNETIYEIDTTNQLITHKLNMPIREIFCDSKNNLWLSGKNKGIQMYKSSDLTADATYEYFSNDFGLVRHEDSDNGIWIVSRSKGVHNIYNPEVIKIELNNTSNKESMSNAICKVGNNLIIGGKDFLAKMDLSKYQIKEEDLSLFQENFWATALYPDIGDTYWLGGYNGISYVDEDVKNFDGVVILNKTQGHLHGYHNMYKPIKLFTTSSQTTIVVSQHQIGRFKDTLKPIYSDFFEENITDACLYEDSLLYLIYKNKLHREIGDSLQEVSLDNSSEFEVSGIECFDKALWLLSLRGELWRISKNHKAISKINTPFPCKAIHKLDSNSLLIRNEVGFSILRKNGDSYDESFLPCDLPDPAYGKTNIVKHNNDLYVATRDGVYKLDLSKTDKRIPSPTLIIEQVEIDSSSYKINIDSLNFKSNSTLGIHYTALNYNYPSSQISYRYRLLGTSADWTLTNKQNLMITSFEVGEYCFELQSRLSEGPWGDTKRIIINVSPQYYESWWFRISVSCLIIFIVLLAYSYLNRFKRFRRESKIKQFQAEQKALRAQINPHFLFNVISSLKTLIIQKPKRASFYLNELAIIMRKILEQSFSAFVTLDKELELTQQYLKLEKLRLAEKLDYRIEVDEKILQKQTLVPALILQPFIENAIKHGINPHTKISSIDINIKLHNDNELLISIKDQGKGLGKKQNTIHVNRRSFGIELSRKRVDLLNRLQKKKGSCIVSNRIGPNGEIEGTVVNLKLKI